ncbi:tudor domain-containing 6 isoform X2 [Brienomyrus brachyistius]|uniref:tudor domain-containing 6 isoform X2 n=1 Tax=Brienomyrus brachyistius TaxID=42636 RepID=UPI0020B45509|nr:tudor domain-containing 6 isoform X2 [Brienomyrus brachyistius]
MCSIPGLPTPGASVTVLITRVNLNPLCILVELWGNFYQEREPGYQQLKKAIQFPKERFREFDGNPGDLCLVQVFETWYRGRVVSRNGSNYSVFLIDEGRTIGATTCTLAWGSNDFFQLPPEIEFCVLANVLPLSSENRWSPMALEFLKSLCGKTFDGYIQDVLVPHRAFLVDIPSISKQMYEMGFAKKLSIEKFKLFVSRSLQSISGDVDSVDCHEENRRGNEQVGSLTQDEKWQRYLYPELQTETVETVIVTEVTNPLRIFCQLKVFSQELKKLTDQITQHYEGRVRMETMKAEILGHPCAARGSDGKWYRSVLQQILASSSLVEVLHVDYGKKDFVKLENIKPLAAEFFKMPVVTYVCSLYGIFDKGVGWTAAQVEYLKSLLLHRTVIAKFEYQSLSEGVHYVTLFGDENVNINNLFGMKERCLLETEKSLEEFAIQQPPSSQISQGPLESEKMSSAIHASASQNIEAEHLTMNSSHVGVVQYINNPSEFWIQTQRYGAEFDKLMQGIDDLYSHSVSTEGLVNNPTVGLFCAARSQDNDFYRAVVQEVIGKHIKVYFVDYGNVEVVDQYNLRVLPDKYQELPALALKCALSGVKPKDGKWSQSAIVFFSKAVENKLLDIHVMEKSQDTYIVQLTDPTVHGERNVGKMLCGAGSAECTDYKKSSTQLGKKPVAEDSIVHCFERNQMKHEGTPTLPRSLPTTVTDARSVFKEHLFPIGSSVEVSVSHIKSPNDFWCQMAQNAGSLKLLMEDLQRHYANSKPQQLVEAACVARLPDSGMWYRALIISRHASPYVDVFFIDFGWTEKIPLEDLRPINPIFLKLKGQAFRCSLYNLIHPVDHSALEWSDVAKLEFQNFVDSAAFSHLSLKCTIYAVMCDSENVVFNVVDLETPFQNVCTLLVQKGLANRGLPKKVPHPPFRLDTYYYSTHDVKTGAEEMVQVTFVKSVNHFYCQLRRNSDIIDNLVEKVNYVCRQLQCIDCPKTFGTVCFAKYTDGQWYRGQIKSIHPRIQVHFVDYGDTLDMDKSDLLPIPIEAGEIMSVPVQAIECALSDIPEEVSCEVNRWFEKNVTDHCFTALVVAKEPCGKLIVELYDGKTQLNLMVKGKFHIETPKSGCFSFDGYEKPKNTHDLPVSYRATGQKRSYHKQVIETKCKSAKCMPDTGSGDVVVVQNQQKTKTYSSVGIQWEPLVTTEQSNSLEELDPYSESPARNFAGECERNITVSSKMQGKSFPKLKQLPLKAIEAGSISEVYISHINNPSSFFVQLIEDEEEMYSLLNKINGNQSAGTDVYMDALQEGDLVNAVFPVDGFWYRGVVRNVFRNGGVCIEFIDFGNTATVSHSEISRVDDELLTHPRLSIHCSLSALPFVNEEVAWNQEDVANFKKTVGDENKLMCTFIKQVESVWEVSLEDRGMVIADVLFKNSATVTACDTVLEDPQTIIASDKSETVISSYKLPEIFEGQAFDVYASCITGPHYFWCQYADTDELQRITKAAEDFGKAAEQNNSWVESVSPGSPCLALFEDEQWYRAVVIAKTDKALSVLFVDYGNECDVDINKVKQVPPELMESPPQAFLCLLSGFDASLGSWDDNALEHFTFVIDDLLKVTIVKAEDFMDYRIPPFQVSLECKGQVLNDAMRPYWKIFASSVDSIYTCIEQYSPEEGAAAHGSSSIALLGIESNGEQTTTDASSEELCEKSTECILHNQSNLNLPENKPAEEHNQNPSILVELQSEEEQNKEEKNLSVNSCHEEGLEDGSPVLSVRDNEKGEEGEFMEEKETEEPTKVTEENPNTISEDLFGQEEPESSPLEMLANEEGDVCRHIAQMKATSSSLKMNTEEDIMGSNSPTSDLLQDMMEEGEKHHANENESHMEQAYLLDGMNTPVCRDNENGQLVEEDKQPDQGIFKESSRLFGEDVRLLSISAREDAEECIVTQPNSSSQSRFGRLKISEDQPVLGSECIIWSYVHNIWCRAKVFELFDDSVKVLLLDHDGDAIVDLQNIFRKAPEDAFQESSVLDCNGLQQEPCEADGTMGSGNDLSTAATSKEVTFDSVKVALFAESEETGLEEQIGNDRDVTALDVKSVAETKPAVYGSGDESFGEQLSKVMHLTLKIEKLTDDDVSGKENRMGGERKK